MGCNTLQDSKDRIRGLLGRLGYGRSPCELFRRLSLPGWNIIHSGPQGSCQAGRRSGFTICKDDGVAMVISLFHPGRVRGLAHGKCMDAGDWRSGQAVGFGFVTASACSEQSSWKHKPNSAGDSYFPTIKFGANLVKCDFHFDYRDLAFNLEL